MKPKIGQKVTYVDESCEEFTAKINNVFDHENQKYSVSIEYRRNDRSIGKVNAVPFVDGIHNVDSNQKVMCFSKKTPKKSAKKPESIPDPSDIAVTPEVTTAIATGPETITETVGSTKPITEPSSSA